MTLSNEICPICGEGNLHPSVGKNSVEYKGEKTELDMHYSECGICGSEQASAIQLRDNKRAMIAFRKQVDGLLTGKEVRALREYFNITQPEASTIFGGGPVAFSKYESDDVAQAESMDKFLRTALAVPAAFEYAARGVVSEPDDTGEWLKIAPVGRRYSGFRVLYETKSMEKKIYRNTA